MGWFYFALSAIFLFTTLDILQRTISVQAKYPRAMSVVFNFWGVVFALLVFVIVGGYKDLSFPTNFTAWIWAGVAVFTYAMFERGRFLVSKLLEVSVFAIVSNLSLVVSFAGSIFLYSEPLTIRKIIGAIFVIFSLFLISFVGKIKKVSAKGLLAGIAIFTFIGIAVALDKKGTTFFKPDLYQVLVWTLPLIFIYFPYVKSKELVYEAKRGSWKIILLALINVSGYYFQLRALALGQAIVILPLIQTFTILTVFMGIVLLGERDYIWRKIIAALIGLIGAYLLVVA